MAKGRGRPPGATNLAYREESERLGLKIADLLASDPDLKIWQAIGQVAPEACNYDGDDSAQGRVPRRLKAFWDNNATRFEEAARRRRNPPPPPRPLTLVEITDQMNETARFARSIQDSPLLREEARLRRLLAWLKPPNIS